MEIIFTKYARNDDYLSEFFQVVIVNAHYTKPNGDRKTRKRKMSPKASTLNFFLTRRATLLNFGIRLK
jgi:hypothetical protein